MMDPNASSDEESNLSTITSFTETPRSQSEISSITTENTTSKNSPEPLHDLICSKFDLLIEQLTRNKQLPKELITFCEGMKEQYLTQQIPEQSNYADVNKLKSLALRYSNLLSSVDHKSRSMEILKKANDELNQYISDMENFHTKQMASLKATLSLNRIETEVRSQTPSQSPSSAIVSVLKTQNNKKRRSSILRFFSRNSASNLSASSLPEIAELEVRIDHEEETKRIKEELLSKTIMIEELRKKCNDFEQKEKILESAIHNKNIELSVKNTRMSKMNDNLKMQADSEAKFIVMLNRLQDTAGTLTRKMGRTQADMRHNRVKLKDNQEKVKKMELIVHKTNEENKMLLTKVNTRNYELSTKKLNNEKLIKDVKKFLLSVISLTEQHEEGECVMEEEATKNNNDDELKSQEQILKRLMRISKTKLSKLLQDKQKSVDQEIIKKQHQSTTVDQSSQTTSTTFEEQTLLNAKTSEQKVKSDLKKLDEELRNFDNNKDSGMSIAGDIDFRVASMLKTTPSVSYHYPSQISLQQQPTVARVSNDERSSPCKNGPHFSKDFVDYVEYMKNREIDAYKEDLKNLEKDNYQLKSALEQTKKKVHKLQVDVQYDKTKSRSSPSKQYGTTRLTSPYDNAPKIRPEFLAPKKSFHAEMFPPPPNFDLGDFPTSITTDNLSANTRGLQNEEDMFFDSFEKSSQLIQGIFQERDALERSIELTRQQQNKGLRTR